MHPVNILLIVLACITWAYWIYLVNEEIDKLQILAGNDKKTSYELDLKIPAWSILKRMSMRPVWVIIALIIAPLLVVVWGSAIILGLIFILLPSAAYEVFDEVRWTIKRSLARR